MNREDAIAILSTLKVAYPQFYRDISKEEAKETVNLWTTMFMDESIQIVTEAVKSLLCTCKFPPTIADIKEKIRLITETPSMSELEAWSIVSKAINDSYYNAKKHFDNFPEIIKKSVGTSEQLRMWGQMDCETVNSVTQSNFIRSYRAMVQHELQFKSLPESAKKMKDLYCNSNNLIEG